MSGLRILAATFLSGTLLATGAAQAMEIRQFDKLAIQDRSEYVAELIEGAQKVLIDEGKSDLAARINKLFTEKPPAGDATPLGFAEFASNLDLARVADAERAAQDPNAHRLEVEDAILVTFKKNNFPLSQDFIREFRAVGSNFKP
jgi:hypothetical protein